MVEFSLVFPVFMTVLLFFFEAWRVVQCQQTVDQAAFEAARIAIVPGKTVADAQARANLVLASTNATKATVTISPDPITEATEKVTVRITLPLSDVGLFFKYFSPDYTIESVMMLDHENARIGRL
jgi:Flp pilus assembly protein TadG